MAAEVHHQQPEVGLRAATELEEEEDERYSDSAGEGEAVAAGVAEEERAALALALGELGAAGGLVRAGAEYWQAELADNPDKRAVCDELREYAAQTLANITQHLTATAAEFERVSRAQAGALAAAEASVQQLAARVQHAQRRAEAGALAALQQPGASQRMPKSYNPLERVQ